MEGHQRTRKSQKS